jgi:ATP-dependent helicase HrpA
LFSQLSAFIRNHYGLIIPATAWSEDHLADHLKMRISIRDHKDREITSLRDPSILNRFPHAAPQPGTSALDRARQTFEKTEITNWTFSDLPEDLCIDEPDGFTRKVYPGLKIEDDTLSLRLFLSRQEAETTHVQGIRRLYEHGFPDLFKAVKKEIRSTGDLKRIAMYFGGPAAFQNAVYICITRHLFEKNLRTRAAFESYIQKLRPTLFQQTQDLIQDIQAVGRAYAECFSLIQALSLKHQARPQASRMLADLFEGLKNLVPPHFLSLYSIQRIQHLPRYVDCLRIRAQRGADNPAKESEKAKKISRFEHHLATQVAGLSEKTSPEKAEKVEDFFWLLEEYKISVFAQELKTAVKVSAKRLEKELHTLSTLI